MIRKFISWFGKSEEGYDIKFQLPEDESAKFILSVDNINVGSLYCENSQWYYQYSDDFKKHSNEYKRIVGFPDLEATYKSDTLWPFFQVRIPGLKQPAIQEIISKEKIDKENEVELLKRFGRKTIANPYELVMA